MSRFLGYVLISFLVLLSFHAQAKDARNKLTEVIQKIKNVQTLIQEHQSKQVNLQRNLQMTEVAINQISLKLQKTESELGHKQQTINSLISKQRSLDLKIKKQQQMLLQQIKAGYILGLNNNKLHLLLKSSDPEKINRLLTYNRYMSLHNYQLIQNLTNDFKTLQGIKEATVTEANYLATIKNNHIDEQKDLQAHRHDQQLVLKNLSLVVKSHTEQLNELLKNKKNLEGVIEKLQKKETYASDFLSHHHGRFPWPTSGKIIEKFGSNIQNSELKQNGVLISAPEGQNVYAVAPGKVIFADWMPGYGLLLIIDHGKDYMTLYGNNGVLFKKNHALVGNHELIARVGHTGGQLKSMLYFALRYKGKPVNPSIWCG